MIANAAPFGALVHLNDPLYVIRAAYDAETITVALPQGWIVAVVLW
jgi:hypothetical protein